MSCFLLINLSISNWMLLPALYMQLPLPRRWFAKYNTGYMVGKTTRGVKPWSSLLLPCTFLALAHLWPCLQEQAVLLHKHEGCWNTTLTLSDRCIWKFLGNNAQTGSSHCFMPSWRTGNQRLCSWLGTCSLAPWHAALVFFCLDSALWLSHCLSTGKEQKHF